jgi:hypothetical protein
VATAASPLTFVATGNGTFTLAGSLTTIQINRGGVATAHLVTTATRRCGLALDYDPVTHAARGLWSEQQATNLLLNSATLSTQSVTVTAVAHTLSFFGTGTVTLTGVSTAGPLTGTGASNRVSLTFTPTAGSLTCTVTGTVTRAQLETGSVATSVVPSFASTGSRATDQYLFTSASINHSATAGSWWCECYMMLSSGTVRAICYTSTAAPVVHDNSTSFYIFDGTLKAIAVTGLIGTTHKVASAWTSGARAVTADGLTVGTDAGSTTNLLAPGTSVFFGHAGAGASPINGYIRKAFYVPRKMTNPELVAKTA